MKNKEEEVVDSPWYYFYSVGCAFCKQLEPIIDDLNQNGHDILKLDLTVADNNKLAKELQDEYGKKCGTPWLINADTGNHICGYREKDILEKWLDGEDIPAPPSIQGKMPKLPFFKDSKTKVKKWKKEYNEWLEKNKAVPNLQTANQMLNRPRPNSDPPMLPAPNTVTDGELEKFKVVYEKWVKENTHLPNVQSVKQIIDRINNQRKTIPNVAMKNLENKVNLLESKLDKMMKHFGVK